MSRVASTLCGALALLAASAGSALAQDELEEDPEVTLGAEVSSEDDDEGEAGGGGGARNTGGPYPAVALVLGIAGTEERGPAEIERNFTFGLLGRYMLPVHEWVTIGGQVAARSWQSEFGATADASRNLLLEVAFVPALNYPATPEIEAYAILPIGLALNFAGEGDIASDAGLGTGLAVGFLVGARFFLDPGFGLLAELGYMSHSFTHSIDEPVEAELDIHIDEASIDVGLFF